VEFQDSEMVLAGFEGAKVGLKVFEESLFMPWVNVRQRAFIILALT